MHGYILMRGVKHQLELTKKFMETTMLKWNTKNILSEHTLDRDVQFAMRPIELFECVFPEESLPQFMAMLNLRTDDKYQGYMFNTQMNLLRKMLGAQKFPDLDYKTIKNIPFIPLKGVAIHPIGFKEDKKGMIAEKVKGERL